jgi:hypothetical protein
MLPHNGWMGEPKRIHGLGQSQPMDAKTRMDQAPDCQDEFVTKGGTKDDDVVGWITNVIIADNSRV